jgi:hypothetical protein
MLEVMVFPLALPPNQWIVLKRLARGPAVCTGGERPLARRLEALGLARRADGPAERLAYEITPAGRRYIALNGQASRAFVRGQAHAARGLGPPAGPGRLGAIADLQADGRAVVSRCQACGAQAAVDLDLLSWRLGARTELWGRRAACAKTGCDGQALYRVCRPDGSTTALADQDPPN